MLIVLLIITTEDLKHPSDFVLEDDYKFEILLNLRDQVILYLHTKTHLLEPIQKRKNAAKYESGFYHLDYIYELLF